MDLCQVAGQESAKRCLEIAAAGRHTLAIVGPPGSGKSMLAQRAATIGLEAREIALGAKPEGQWILTARPCSCGFLGDPARECTCRPKLVERYRCKLLAYPAELWVDTHPLSSRELERLPGEPSADVRRRVEAARKRVEARGIPTRDLDNSHPALASARPDAGTILAAAFDRLRFTAEQMVGFKRVARTIADLAGHDIIGASDIAEALAYRTMDPRLEMNR